MKTGDIIKLRNGEFEVILINASRARIRCIKRETVVGMAYNPATGKQDKPFSFLAPAAETDISPQSQVKVIGNTGRKPQPRVTKGGFIMPVDL